MAAVDLCYGVQTDATVIALLLLSGNAYLLWADRGPILAAAASLMRPRAAEPRALGWGLAIVLLGAAFAISAAAQILLQSG